MSNVWTGAPIPLTYKHHISIYGMSLGVAGLRFPFSYIVGQHFPESFIIVSLPPLIQLYPQTLQERESRRGRPLLISLAQILAVNKKR